MVSLELKQRVLQNNDWITILFVLCFIIIGMTRNAYSNRFNDYIRLLVSNKYTVIYRDNSNLKSWFTVILFAIQVISYSLFIQYLLYYFFDYQKNDYLLFIRIVNGLIFYILAKFIIEKIIATIFNIEDFIEQYNLLKISYRTYVSLMLLPVLLLLFYNKQPIIEIVFIIIGVLLVSNLVIYGNGLKVFQKLIIGNLFYFILYLCTLEIAPYYFVYCFFTKK
jgi:hypothetical protein